MSKYTDIRDEFSKIKGEGIEYVFGDKQWKEYLERHNLTEEQAKATLVGDGYGGIGTKEAFKKRDEAFKVIEDKIRKECNPDDIFSEEWWNHECGLTYDYTPALNITRSYFPNYTPKQTLINKLNKEFGELNW